MRYADQPTVEVKERIQGDPDVIWNLVTDIAMPARFSPELQTVEWIEGDAVAVGNRFAGTNKSDHMGEWTTECTVVEVDPGRRWVWEVRSGDLRMASWGFEVDPGREATTVRQWARMGPDPSGITVAIEATPDREGRIIAYRLDEWRKAMAANLLGLKQMVEAGEA